MHNLAARKMAGLQQSIEAAGARLAHLPSDSPGSKQIGMAFAKLKALSHTAAARTVPGLWAAIRDAFTRVKPRERRNDLAAAG